MGFNEPDNAACANVQPGPAAVAWPGIVANARATMPGIKLASPAVMNLGSSWWLQQFFGAICPGGLARCSVAPDYLAVHIYTLDSGDFIGQLQEWNRQFPTLPIIVNEFACTTFGGAIPSQAQVNQFMNDVTTFMDDTPWVVKYAWFGAAANSFDLHGVAEANRLVDQSGTITAL
ncbi:hypothetical protein M231_05546 [Tremella mesenterica]|uniref:Asl1-like glycosyl hydrolase catalytic domain-containing protein n=2 Tax=Tremella mesenterica TaxID=5217 RepID=A0A4V1M3K4_TREME|nr:hypothetical protein M231_05546 [Tremella mesenterica]